MAHLLAMNSPWRVGGELPLVLSAYTRLELVFLLAMAS